MQQSKNRYIPKYFVLEELLPPMMFTYDDMMAPKHLQHGWALIDQRLLVVLDVIRGEIIKEPLICNTWHMNGNRKFSGLRPDNCTVGASKSQHKLGKAADLLCYKYTAEQMRQMIIENQDLLPYPIRMEDGVAWLHIDVKDQEYKDQKIYLFKA